jgi:hypothetical protein
MHQKIPTIYLSIQIWIQVQFFSSMDMNLSIFKFKLIMDSSFFFCFIGYEFVDFLIQINYGFKFFFFASLDMNLSIF